MADRSASDERYVLDLCDLVLGSSGQRQATFDWLRSDRSPARPEGTELPVDAYWPQLGLVLEFHEEQHTPPSPFFDRRSTVSGIGRGEQRRLYDERGRDLNPQHGLRLVVTERTAFAIRPGRIIRDRARNLETANAHFLNEKLGRSGVDPKSPPTNGGSSVDREH